MRKLSEIEFDLYIRNHNKFKFEYFITSSFQPLGIIFLEDDLQKILIHRKSDFTKEEINAKKAIEGYKQYVDEYVFNVQIHIVQSETPTAFVAKCQVCI